MTARRTLFLALAMALVSAVALGADAPAPTPAKVEIPTSNRWFVITMEKGAATTGYLRITLKESGHVDAPVQVVYETNNVHGLRNTVTGFCRNDEWLSPVTIWTTGAGVPITATIRRPNPKSTAGKMTWEIPLRDPIDMDINEHTVLYYMPLDIAARMPFEKDKTVEFSTFGPSCSSVKNCTLSYAGEEEVEFKGNKQLLHKFSQKGLWLDGPEYWFNTKHELVCVTFGDDMLTPATEAEARKAAEKPEVPAVAELKANPDLPARMSEGVAGCGMIRSQMRVYFAQNGGAYPTFKDAGAKEFAATLGIGAIDLDGKYFKAGDYVVNSTPKEYTIKVSLGDQTYIINQDGREVGTYKTGQ